jgi:hypothetical protein
MLSYFATPELVEEDWLVSVVAEFCSANVSSFLEMFGVCYFYRVFSSSFSVLPN